jgi:hypothetical protein
MDFPMENRCQVAADKTITTSSSSRRCDSHSHSDLTQTKWGDTREKPNSWMVYFMENPIYKRFMIWEVPYFRKPPLFGSQRYITV